MNHGDRIKELEEVCKDRNFQITRLQVEKEQAEAREKVLREALTEAAKGRAMNFAVT